MQLLKWGLTLVVQPLTLALIQFLLELVSEQQNSLHAYGMFKLFWLHCSINWIFSGHWGSTKTSICDAIDVILRFKWCYICMFIVLFYFSNQLLWWGKGCEFIFPKFSYHLNLQSSLFSSSFTSSNGRRVHLCYKSAGMEKSAWKSAMSWILPVKLPKS